MDTRHTLWCKKISRKRFFEVLLVSLFAIPLCFGAWPRNADASYSAPYGEGGYYGQGYYQSYYQSYYESYYYGQGYYQGSYRITISGNFGVSGNVSVTSNLGKGSGSFVIDHPLDPVNKLLFHSFLESPDVKNLYDGIATLNENGEAVIDLPPYFEALNRDFRYQLKGLSSAMPHLHIKQEIKGNRFLVGGGTPTGTISWQVTGIRHDPYILKNPVIPEIGKVDTLLVPRGEYLHPELYKDGSALRRVQSFLAGLFKKD